MDLNYRIIWADDNLAYKSMQTIIGKVEAHISSHGFNPIITKCYNLSELNDAVNIPSKCRDVDLIISDYNLGSGKHCTEILNLMARERIYAELVLYATNANTLKSDLLNNYDITRISVLDRQGMDLADEIIDIIGWHLDKEFDVESFRGIVLNESSDIDVLMEEVIRKILSWGVEHEVRDATFKHLSGLIKGHLKIKLKGIQTFVDCNVLQSEDNCNKFMKLLDSRKKSKGTELILEELKCRNKHNSTHYKELQDKRNRLGHDPSNGLTQIKEDYVSVFRDYNHFKHSLIAANKEIEKMLAEYNDPNMFE